MNLAVSRNYSWCYWVLMECYGLEWKMLGNPTLIVNFSIDNLSSRICISIATPIFLIGILRNFEGS